jgi:hypothetical protein
MRENAYDEGRGGLLASQLVWLQLQSTCALPLFSPTGPFTSYASTPPSTSAFGTSPRLR